MSSTASLPNISRSEIRRRNPALRILYYAICLLLVALIAAVWWLYWIARRPLPQLDGSVSVSGISSKVRVIRDEHGVPTIEAATLADLFFAQGYVTAQDRLWQMDMMRRAAAGELSEVIGESTVKMDRDQRILGLRSAAEAAEKSISARDRVYFDAYARGVNAFLESHRDRLSLEFRLMKYAPRPWTVTDSLLVGALLVEYLNHYPYVRALEREKILAKLGPELTADLYVNSSWRDRPPTEVRRIEGEPAANSGDSDEDDDEEVDPESGSSRLTSALPPGSGFINVVQLGGHVLQRLKIVGGSSVVPPGLESFVPLFPAPKSVRENWVVPPGLGSFLPLFPALKCVRENWVVPPGLRSLFPLFPALKRWAKLVRPSGAVLSSSSFYRMAKTPVLTHTLKRWAKLGRPSGAEYFYGAGYSFGA